MANKQESNWNLEQLSDRDILYMPRFAILIRTQEERTRNCRSSHIPKYMPLSAILIRTQQARTSRIPSRMLKNSKRPLFCRFRRT